MKVFRILAVACALTMAFTPSANAVVALVPPPPPGGGPPGGGPPGGGWFIIGCAGLIVLAAVKHAKERELTKEEAWSCGLLGLLAPTGTPEVKAIKVKG
jgi:hypothetical protein